MTRASINVISNNIVLDEFDKIGADSLLRREFPPEMILPFMHEVTHHWCFNSPVGFALTLLYADAIERNIKLIEIGENLELETRDRFTRCLILDNLLEPLYEGMALFAEQNVVSIHADVTSFPFLITGLHFGYSDFSTLFSELSTYLTTLRRSIGNIKRKTAILSGPGDPGKNPYLAGYITVMACFYRVASKIDLCKDPDFFLLYLKSFMFDDFAFVNCIMKPNRSLAQFGNDVQNYFHNRLTQFLMIDHSDLVERLNQRLLSASAISDGQEFSEEGIEAFSSGFLVMANDCNAAERGRVAMNNRVKTIYRRVEEEKASADIATRSVYYGLANLLSTRRFMRLASAKVWIVISNNGIDLAVTESDYAASIAQEGGTVIRLSQVRIQENERLSDGPAILEAAVLDTIPFFLLRALKENEPGQVLATFGHATTQSLPITPAWGHSTLSKMAGFVDDPFIFALNPDGRYTQEIQEMAAVRDTLKQKLRFMYEPGMTVHLLPTNH